jgi:hypothetical protein
MLQPDQDSRRLALKYLAAVIGYTLILAIELVILIFMVVRFTNTKSDKDFSNLGITMFLICMQIYVLVNDRERITAVFSHIKTHLF